MRIMHNNSMLLVAIAALLFAPVPVWAHCDGMDGPVVTEARIALEQGDVTSVLKWVPKQDEQKVRDAFDLAVTVRQIGGEAREVADLYFFETLVRLHRASEGAAFEGLKPSGTKISPAIVRADAALDRGDVDKLASEIAQAVETSIREQFAVTLAAMEDKDDSVASGRQFVHEYVQFVHYVKYLHEAVTGEHDYGHGSESHR